MVTAVKVPFVDLKRQDAAIRDEIEAAMRRVIDDAAFIQGPYVERFEHAFAGFLGARHVVGVANGTDALLLALKALGIGAGDEVIIPANTFIATAEAAMHLGARPVLVDADPRTYNIAVDRIEGALTPRTKAIIPVHLYGQPADMGPILELAARYGVFVVEDAAQAQGAEYHGRRAGTLGHVACFSFYPAKNLGAYGDAGAVVTGDDRVASAVRRLGNHGGIEKYRHDLPGYNSRLDALQAAVLTVKLGQLDRWNQMRRDSARSYDRVLGSRSGVTLPEVQDGVRHVYHLYVVRVPQRTRDGLRAHLSAQGIQTGIHYPNPLHLTPAMSDLGYRRGAFPVAEQCAETVLSLPMYPGLEPGQIEFVAEQIRIYFTAGG